VSRIPVTRALVSVYDKTGIEGLCRRLAAAGVEIVSSGGTARALQAAGIPVVAVSEVTGAPEILGGRVKTLHPAIHGGILADPSDPGHRRDLEEQGISPFQLVVCNLYPFAATASRATASPAEVVEQIDIGGPAMIRAAAKNHGAVCVVTDPAGYDEVAAAVEAGGTDLQLRRRYAGEAFFHTAAYDAAIVAWLEAGDDLPEHLVLPLLRRRHLRYGENPHQEAALYAEAGSRPWWEGMRQVQGKELSFNNIADAEAAWRLCGEFAGPAAVVVKHANPCGAAEADALEAAFTGAWAGDSQAAFGGVVALSRPVDEATARQIAGRFIEVVVAPGLDEAAGAVLTARTNLRVLEAPPLAGGDLDLRRVERGFLAQARDSVGADGAAWEVATARPPTDREWEGLRLAWKVAAHTRSNAIVLAAGRQAVGVGAGDQSRVGAARRALEVAGERALGAVAAGDAFFPFRDGIDALAAAGVTAVVHPGGSVRDAEVVAAADEHGMAMVTTGRRHFLH